jgi:uncharacterized RDD family membrane protein YckC
MEKRFDYGYTEPVGLGGRFIAFLIDVGIWFGVMLALSMFGIVKMIIDYLDIDFLQ